MEILTKDRPNFMLNEAASLIQLSGLQIWIHMVGLAVFVSWYLILPCSRNGSSSLQPCFYCSTDRLCSHTYILALISLYPGFNILPSPLTSEIILKYKWLRTIQSNPRIALVLLSLVSYIDTLITINNLLIASCLIRGQHIPVENRN